MHKEGGKGVNRVGKDYGPHVVVETGGPEEGSTNNGNDLGHVYLCGSEGVLVFWSVCIGEWLLIKIGCSLSLVEEFPVSSQGALLPRND